MCRETIERIEVTQLNIPLERPFQISLATQHHCRNVLVKITTSEGVAGYGEAAPSAHVTGETPRTVVAACQSVKEEVVGRPVADYRGISTFLQGTISGQRAARAGIESAVFDALCRSLEIPLASFIGGRDESVTTDMTIGMGDPKKTRGEAKRISDAGFDSIKIKVGGDLETDIDRVLQIRDKAPSAKLKADANQGYDVKEAIRFSRRLREQGVSLDLLEQPVHRGDLAGLARVRAAVDIPIAADESLFTSEDALEIVKQEAADIFNVKLAKSGLVEILDIIGIGQAANLELMIGCMIETRLGIAAGAHLVAGTGAFSFVDLDGHFSLEAKLDETVFSPEIEVRGPGLGVDASELG